MPIAQPLAALPPYGCGIPLAGATSRTPRRSVRWIRFAAKSTCQQRRAEGSPPYADGDRCCAQSQTLRRARCPHRAANFGRRIDGACTGRCGHRPLRTGRIRGGHQPPVPCAAAAASLLYFTRPYDIIKVSKRNTAQRRMIRKRRFERKKTYEIIG